jgi:hypothetical protein
MRRSVFTTLVILLVLPGCAAAESPAPEAPPTAALTATATPQPTVAPAPTSTPTPSPAPPPAPSETPAEPVLVDCDTVLTDEEYGALEGEGLTLDPDILALDSVMQALMDEGLGCSWSRTGGDVRVWFAQSEQGADTWAAQRQQLVDEGWTQTDSPTDGVLQAPADHDPNYQPVIIHLDGVTYYASYSEFLTSVPALVG